MKHTVKEWWLKALTKRTGLSKQLGNVQTQFGVGQLAVSNNHMRVADVRQRFSCITRKYCAEFLKFTGFNRQACSGSVTTEFDDQVRVSRINNIQ